MSVRVKCYSCNKEFKVKPYRAKTTKNICCSRECSNKMRTIEFSGNKNHQHGLRGSLNPGHKSDIYVSNYGYLLIRSLLHPYANCDGFVFMHRLIMEQHFREIEDYSYLTRVDGYPDWYLSKDVVVHHKDENKLNNSIDNLEVMSLTQHCKQHNNLYTFTEKGKVLKTTRTWRVLTKKHALDAGLDIAANKTGVIKARNSKLVSTGLHIEVPFGHVGLIWSRSGLAVKHGVEVGAGCIDSGFTGEIIVLLYNHSEQEFKYNKGDRIAQLLTIPINLNYYEEVDKLNKTDRGFKGFGSTGVK